MSLWLFGVVLEVDAPLNATFWLLQVASQQLALVRPKPLKALDKPGLWHRAISG
jgi:hypothetical protein